MLRELSLTSSKDRFLHSVTASLQATPSGTRVTAVVRTIIASAQIITIVTTSADARFAVLGDGSGGEPKCDALGRISAYCLAPGLPIVIVDILLCLLLVAVIIGYFPKVLGVVHYWVTLSISASIVLPDGGEAAAQVAMLFLLFISLSDSRRNHWHRESFEPSFFMPVAVASWWGIRGQAIWIYLHSSMAKTSVDEWIEGSAVYYVVRGPFFGTSGPLEGFFLWATEIPAVALAMAWGAIIMEFTLAIWLLLAPRGTRHWAWYVSILLHVGFIVMIGLWSFALVMIALVLAACGPKEAPWKSWSTRNALSPEGKWR